ncbi:MAG TPA: DNA-directed RNA polymerase subunit H [Candidatus Lokiarchaeia archaeon]|nr:DNA-directed RNA polymerase subunit H [Candidatus Lokiarchaeia archaeon]
MAKKIKKKFKKIDILRHELIPKHVIMSKEEVDELLAKYQIKLVQLPRISVDDPVINMLGGKLNDVIKIERRSETSVEKSYYYRFVVKMA